MSVIAMTREMGSLGKDVALGLADELGLRLIHHEMVEHDLAQRLKLGESAVHRFLEANASIRERWSMDKDGLSLFTAEEILELAAQGNVLIRGWGATHLLKPVAHALRIRVCAPMPSRVQVLMQRMGIEDEALARKEIEANDTAHTRTMLKLFRSDWQDPLHYNAVFNTERVPIDCCVQQILSLIRSDEFRETEASIASLSNLALEARVNAALYRQFGGPTRNRIIDVSVDSNSGTLALRGVVPDKSMAGDVIGLLRSVPGIREIQNDLLVMRARFDS